jgi:hypothetical protein
LEAGIPARLTPTEGRKFGLTVGGAFVVLGAILQWRGHPSASAVCLTGGAGLALAGLLAPAGLSPVYRGWMGLAYLLSKVTTPIFMGAVYFLVITPMGLLMRLFGKDPLVHRAVNNSYWHRREPHSDPTDTMRHQF